MCLKLVLEDLPMVFELLSKVPVQCSHRTDRCRRDDVDQLAEDSRSMSEIGRLLLTMKRKSSLRNLFVCSRGPFESERGMKNRSAAGSESEASLFDRSPPAIVLGSEATALVLLANVLSLAAGRGFGVNVGEKIVAVLLGTSMQDVSRLVLLGRKYLAWETLTCEDYGVRSWQFQRIRLLQSRHDTQAVVGRRWRRR